MHHELTQIKVGDFDIKQWYCAVCKQTWVSKPRSKCAGIEVVRGTRPENLLPKSYFAKRGLRLPKGTQPAALYDNGFNRYPLYDISNGISKRAVTDKQRAALAEARTKSQCRDCGARFVRLKDGYCPDCAYERRVREMLKADRRAAILWARDVICDERAVILDTETTGLDPLSDGIVQIGIVETSTGRVLLDSYIKPDRAIDERVGWEEDVDRPWRLDLKPINAFTVNDIRNADVFSAPTFAEIYPLVAQVLHGRRVVVYNAAFDSKFIWELCKRHALPHLNFHFNEWECAMLAYAMFFGEWSDRHQSYTWQKLHGNHGAVGDAIECRRLILNMSNCDLGEPRALEIALR